ncbi:MAG: hypothetical protein WBL67_00715 [Nitrososphaeraceae archaeon]
MKNYSIVGCWVLHPPKLQSLAAIANNAIDKIVIITNGTLNHTTESILRTQIARLKKT